jgi:CMP-N-acetylneuraminic acid synthetase
LNKDLEFFNKQYAIKRPQGLTKSYHDDGRFYRRFITIWLGKKQTITNSIGFSISKCRSVDIDNLDDKERTELLFRVIKFNEKNYLH